MSDLLTPELDPGPPTLENARRLIGVIRERAVLQEDLILARVCEILVEHVRQLENDIAEVEAHVDSVVERTGI